MLCQDQIIKTNLHIIQIVKNSINADGYWEGGEAKWNQIVTLCNFEVLLNFGLSINETWDVTGKVSSFEISMQSIINYLNGEIFFKENIPKFGEDLWDLLRLAIVIVKYDLQKYFPDFEKIKKYCINVLPDLSIDDLENLNNVWSGPAILSVLIDFLSFYEKERGIKSKMNLLKRCLTERIQKNWSIETVDKDVRRFIWHTSQVIRNLTDDDIKKELFDKLENVYINQIGTNDNYLDEYYRAYVAMACLDVNKSDCDLFNTLLKHFIDKINNDKINTRGELSQLSTFFSKLVSDGKIIGDIDNAKEYSKLKLKYEELLEENKNLKKQVIDTNKYKVIKIHKRLLKILMWIFITIVAATISTIIGVIIKYFLGVN